ncbi:MAG: YihY/virulence factor BrkB family protein [Candidatus Competibacteraceae bacterium]|nr:YihY/virulence factor BrkB family protein [Candidatus Competibacteraceae bacterium]
MTTKETWFLIKTTFISWSDDHAQSMGAALAYYTLFSMAPLLLIVIAMVGLMFGEAAARGEIAGQFQILMGEQGALAVQALVESVNQPTQGFIATLIGGGLLLIGATTVFGELQNSLDRIWRAPGRDRSDGLWRLIRSRLLSFGMILGIGFVLMVSLVLSAGLSALEKWWSPRFEGLEVMANVVNLIFSFGLTTGLFALIYKIMPRVRIRWDEVWIGAALTSLLFTIGKFLIDLYIGRSGVTSGFGAAGSLVALLVWVYYSAQIFLLGAEFTWAYSHIFGSRKHQPAPRDLAKALDESGADTLQSSSEIAKTAYGKSPSRSQPVAGQSGDSMG